MEKRTEESDIPRVVVQITTSNASGSQHLRCEHPVPGNNGRRGTIVVMPRATAPLQATSESSAHCAAHEVSPLSIPCVRVKASIEVAQKHTLFSLVLCIEKRQSLTRRKLRHRSTFWRDYLQCLFGSGRTGDSPSRWSRRRCQLYIACSNWARNSRQSTKMFPRRTRWLWK